MRVEGWDVESFLTGLNKGAGCVVRGAGCGAQGTRCGTHMSATSSEEVLSTMTAPPPHAAAFAQPQGRGCRVWGVGITVQDVGFKV